MLQFYFLCLAYYVLVVASHYATCNSKVERWLELRCLLRATIQLTIGGTDIQTQVAQLPYSRETDALIIRLHVVAYVHRHVYYIIYLLQS